MGRALGLLRDMGLCNLLEDVPICHSRSLSLLAAAVGAQTTAQSAPPQMSAATEEAATEGSVEGVESEKLILAVLPFRVHSARSLGYLTESLADLLAERLEASGEFEVVDSSSVREALESAPRTELSDLELRRLAVRLKAQVIVTGSLTQLAGRFSLDLRVTPRDPISRSQTSRSLRGKSESYFR